MKRLTKRGFTLVEIMIVVAIIALLAAIAIPNILRSRATANESAAIGNIRAIISSLEMYRSVNNLYPTDWTNMTGATPAFNPSPFTANISAAGAGVVQGYNYLYTRLTGTTYTLSAVPNATTTGSRQFFANDTAVMRHCLNATTTVVVTGGSQSIDAPPNTTCP